MSFPTPFRSSFGVVRVGDKIVIAGGHVGRFHNYQETRFTAASHVLDINTWAWSEIEAYGSPVAVGASGTKGMPVQGLRLIEHGGEVFGFGGFAYERTLDFADPNDYFQWYARSRTEIFKYSFAQNKWSLIGHLPRPRSSYAVGKIGDKVFLIGGWDGTPMYREDFYGRFYRTIEVFDLTKMQVVPTEYAIDDNSPMRRAFTSTVSGGSIVVVGGLGPATSNDPEGCRYNLVQAFSPNAATNWSHLPSLPFHLFSPSVCDVNGTLVVIGGSRYDRKVNDEVLLLKPGANRWIQNSKKPSKIGTFMELVHLRDRTIAVMGGHGGSNADPDPYGVCETLEID